VAVGPGSCNDSETCFTSNSGGTEVRVELCRSVMQMSRPRTREEVRNLFRNVHVLAQGGCIPFVVPLRQLLPRGMICMSGKNRRVIQTGLVRVRGIFDQKATVAVDANSDPVAPVIHPIVQAPTKETQAQPVRSQHLAASAGNNTCARQQSTLDLPRTPLGCFPDPEHREQ